jgi:hypothetical protein
MRADLLHAEASVNWAESQLPSFVKRIGEWLADNIEIVIEQEPLPATHDTVIAVKKAAFPLTFNVEFGAYINAIRSSLDILATSLAKRYGACKPEDAYFPIARDEASFMTGRYRAKEFVNGLPAAERAIIESLEPYVGGNALLVELNQLDVLRKHQRLIEVNVVPQSLHIPHSGPLGEIFIGEVIFPDRREDKTLLGRIRKDAAGRKLKFTPKVTLREPRSASGKEVAAALGQFASAAHSIINLFDTP